jgi:hypothetical protein
MDKTFIAVSEILFTCSIVMIFVTAVTMLGTRKRRATDAEARRNMKLHLNSTYGKYPTGHYYGETDSTHEKR